jgi:zinc protease
MTSTISRAAAALLTALACAALGCRTPLPPATQPYTLTPDGDFRSAAPKPWEEQESLADIPVQEIRLANGLKVYLVEEPEVPLVSVAYVNKAGEDGAGLQQAPRRAQRAEGERSQPGLATLTARYLLLDTLLDDGTLVSDIQVGGVPPYASVDYSGAAIGLTVVSSGTRVAIETLGAIVQRPVFDPSKIGGLQIAMGNAVFDEGTNLLGLGAVLTSRAMLGEDHPWSMEPRKQIQAIGKITVADVKDFYARRYRPDESAVIVVGNVTRAEVEPILEKSFGGWQVDGARSEPAAAVAVDEVPGAAPVNTGLRRVYALLAGGDQALVVVTQPNVPARHPDAVPLQLVSYVLAGGFTSRANQSLRHESGMTYGVQVEEFGSGRDAFLCIRTFFPQTQVRDGVRKIDAVLDRLRKEPVSEEEIARARTAYLSSLSGGRGTHEGAVALVANLYFNDQTPDDLRALEQQIRAATPADLQRAAQRYFRPNGNLVVISNWQQYGNQLTGLGRVELFEPGRR